MSLSRSRAERSTPLESGDLLRVGVLGCSDIARRKFIPALRHCAAASLAAVAGRDAARTAAYAHAHSCRAMTATELLASADIDLVYLSLPNHLHEEWSLNALKAGKHLICEKPLATSLTSAEKILACATSNNRLIYENQMFLFHPQHAVVKSMLAAGTIGTIKELRSFFGFPFPKTDSFRLDPRQGGGAFLDLARYPLGIANYLLSAEPQNFSGHSTWLGTLNSGVTGTAITAGNELFTFSIAFGRSYEARYEVIGETGSIRLERAYTTPEDYTNSIFLSSADTVTETVIPAADHFRLMLENICLLIRTGSDFSHLNRQAATMARLADNMAQGCMENKYASQ